MTYIHHIDLGTGCASRVARADIDSGLIEWAGDLLTEVLAGGSGHWMAYAVTAVATGRCATVTLSRGDHAHARLGIAMHSRCAATTWRLLTEVDPLTARADLARPAQPWVAVDIARWCEHDEEVDTVLAPALAWAWLDRIRERRAA